jgi:hypothetical protein
MKKITKLATIVLILFTVDYYSQPISTLNQIMTSNPLINRPIEFRAMQQDVYSVLQSTEPGLKANYIYEKMADGRKRLLNYIIIPVVNYKDDSIIISLPVTSDSIIIPNAKAYTRDSLINELKQKVRQGLMDMMKGEEFFESKLGLSVLSRINLFIGASELAVNASTKKGDKNSIDKFATLISGIVFDRAIKWLQLHYSTGFSLAKINDPKELVDTLNSALGEINGILQGRMNSILDKVEDEFTRAITSFSNRLLSGNMGLAVTEGDGALNAGLLLSFIVGESFQFGFYVNGQLNNDSTSVDTTKVNDNIKPNQSLIGGQLRYAWDKIQLDLLISALFKDKNFKAFEVFEGGAGFSYALNSDIILGLAYYIMIHTVEGFNNIHLLGLNVMAKNTSVPSFLLGVQFSNGVTTPVFQISQPINF